MGKKSIVLIVDDEDPILRLMEAMVIPLGYVVSLAHNGEEVLRKVREFPPDVILLDLTLSKMDGLEAIKRFKEDNQTKGIPWDGSGYPKGLKGTEIPKVGQIAALADVFDALTSTRPFKEPFPLEKSYGIIKESRGSYFDPNVVDAFFAVKDEILTIKKQYED